MFVTCRIGKHDTSIYRLKILLSKWQKKAYQTSNLPMSSCLCLINQIRLDYPWHLTEWFVERNWFDCFIRREYPIVTFYQSDMVILFSGQPTPTRPPAPAPGKKTQLAVPWNIYVLATRIFIFYIFLYI